MVLRVNTAPVAPCADAHLSYPRACASGLSLPSNRGVNEARRSRTETHHLSLNAGVAPSVVLAHDARYNEAPTHPPLWLTLLQKRRCARNLRSRRRVLGSSRFTPPLSNRSVSRARCSKTETHHSKLNADDAPSDVLAHNARYDAASARPLPWLTLSRRYTRDVQSLKRVLGRSRLKPCRAAANARRTRSTYAECGCEILEYGTCSADGIEVEN